MKACQDEVPAFDSSSRKTASADVAAAADVDVVAADVDVADDVADAVVAVADVEAHGSETCHHLLPSFGSIA